MIERFDGPRSVHETPAFRLTSRYRSIAEQNYIRNFSAEASRARDNSRLVATVPVIHYYPSSLSESPGPFSGDELARQHHPIRQSRSERAIARVLDYQNDRLEAIVNHLTTD